MLTGDAEYEEESSMLDYYLDDLDKLKAGLYKVGHHGSKTASSYEFLNAMQAEKALISCGLDNRFYHPHPSLIKKLKQKDLEIFRTDEQGVIHCWTNGDPWQCETEK
jgi:competence protein ComEC